MNFNDFVVDVQRKLMKRVDETDMFCTADNLTITAHTGAMHTKPNSLWSAKECMSCGADIIEVDVTQRPDGQFVMIHKRKAKKHEGIPFEYLLDLLGKNNVGLNIDLKSFDDLDVLQKMIKSSGLMNRAFFTGVSKNEIERVRLDAPEIPTYINDAADTSKTEDMNYVEGYVESIVNSGAIGLNTNYLHLEKNIVNKLHDRGIKVSAWTVNKEPAMRRMLEMGVDNITTKNPLLLLKMTGR